jgi:hypothetical protein
MGPTSPSSGDASPITCARIQMMISGAIARHGRKDLGADGRLTPRAVRPIQYSRGK